MEIRTLRHLVIAACLLVPPIVLAADPSPTASPQAPPTPSPAASPAAAATVTLESFQVKVELAPPAGWKALEGTSGFFDPGDPKASFQLTVTPMNLPDTTLKHVNDAAFDQSTAKAKSGQLASCERRTLDGLEGILTVETGQDPTVRRLQWITHARQHYIAFTAAAPPAAFDKYLPKFQAVLDTVKFLAPRPAETK